MEGHEAAIRQELERILASEVLVASPMLAAFLRFVVEETLAGREDRLKAYTIAVGALDRPESFDPNENPVVRVQAHRLRQALQRYYETDGADATLRIDLPLGSYLPAFVVPEPGDGGGDGDGGNIPIVVQRPRRYGLRRLTVSTAAAALIGIVIGFGGWHLWQRVRPPPPAVSRDAAAVVDPTADDRRGLDAGRVLPLLRIEVEVEVRGRDEAIDPGAYRDRIESFARRFDDTVVPTRRPPDDPPPAGQPLYVLHILVARHGDTTNANYRLLLLGDDRVLRSGSVGLSPEAPAAGRSDAPLETPADLAMVRNVVGLHGSIAQDLANISDLGPELTCIGRAWSYRLDATAAHHLAALSCLEPIVAANPRLAPAATLLAVTHLDGLRQGLEDPASEALAKAEPMVRRATRVAPTSSAPFQALQDLMLAKGDLEAAVEAGRLAVQFNPEDMNAVAGHGAALARIGRYDEAVALLLRAEANMTAPPPWLRFYAFLALNNLGRTEEADHMVAQIRGTHAALQLTAVAIRAHRHCDDPGAAAAFAEIAALEPDFATDPHALLHRHGLAEAVIDRLMIDLVAAGLPQCSN